MEAKCIAQVLSYLSMFELDQHCPVGCLNCTGKLWLYNVDDLLLPVGPIL
jgi:hypothetical protein